MRKIPIALMALSAFFFYQCSDDQPQRTNKETTETTGPQLAKQYCSTCHLYPSPDLLDKKTWSEFVLVRMGALLGIYQDGDQYLDKIPEQWIEPGIGGERVMTANIYPSQPTISVDDWKKIVQFYIENAPRKLSSASAKTHIRVGVPGFEVKPFDLHENIAPVVQAMTFDPREKVMYASEYQGGVYKFDSRGETLDYIVTPALFVQMQADEDQFIALDMATRYASDNPQGQLLILDSFKDLRRKQYKNQIQQLMRPVSFTSGDLTGNGVNDYVVAEYGNFIGALSWMEIKSDSSFQRHVLHPDDGAVKSEIRDLNGDGKNDIIALQANSDEGIDWYINQGNGKFKRERKLRFLPTNGSTHFQLVDFNNDGQEDILYSAGDNGDYAPILKPYHGIRLFLNKNGNYEESFFIPLNGVYQAEAFDFDQDGDLDIAAVSFHPDFQSHPEEGFVIYINDGHNKFSAHTIPEVENARWMRFIVEDIDGDQDQDILLSAMNIKTPEIPEEVSMKWRNESNAILFLENKTY